MRTMGSIAGHRRATAAAVLLAAGALSALSTGVAGAASLNGPHLMPQNGHRGGASNSPLIDHGGLVIPNPSIFTVFWGSGFPRDTDTGVSDFLSNLNSVNPDGTSYLHITSQNMRGVTTTAATYTKDDPLRLGDRHEHATDAQSFGEHHRE